MWIEVGTYIRFYIHIYIMNVYLCINASIHLFFCIFTAIPMWGRARCPWPGQSSPVQNRNTWRSTPRWTEPLLARSWGVASYTSGPAHFQTSHLLNTDLCECEIKYNIIGLLLHNKFNWLYTELQPEVAVLTQMSLVELLYYLGVHVID